MAHRWLFLDGECDDARWAALAAHLAHCDTCLLEYRSAAGLKAALRRACGYEPAPATLPIRVRHALPYTLPTQETR